MIPLMNGRQVATPAARSINVNSSNLHGLPEGPQPRRVSGKTHPRVQKDPMDWGASKIPHYPDPRQEVRHG